MKKKTAGILLGVMVSSMLLSACGSNKAKEAANESVQVEEEGKGERTEEGEKVEAEETAEASDTSASDTGDSDGNVSEGTVQKVTLQAAMRIIPGIKRKQRMMKMLTQMEPMIQKTQKRRWVRSGFFFLRMMRMLL